MILLSNGGSNMQQGTGHADRMAVGTVDGVALLKREQTGWTLLQRALAGCFVSAVAELQDGTLFAATHGSGIARSRDGGMTWTWPNKGLTQFDLWSLRSGHLQGREVILAGSQPAHLFISEDAGESWRELPALRNVPSVAHWCFPPPPRIGHVKDIVIDGDRLLVGIEIGALLVSHDGGASFEELILDPDPRECDVHRVLVHPLRPHRLIVANGLMGMMQSNDDGGHWMRRPLPDHCNYPDAVALHPTDPDLIYLTAGVGWPPHWYRSGRARGKIARSRDGGATWERLLGGLPDGQRALFSALTIEAWDGGHAIYAADTDGQIFESLDDGEHWTIIADVPAVSKGEFYRGLLKDRVKLATVDDVLVNEVAAARFAEAKV
jgi:hypothetical protein